MSRYALAQRCWETDPTRRPGFGDVHAELQLAVLASRGVVLTSAGVGGAAVGGRGTTLLSGFVLEYPRSKLRLVRELARSGVAVVRAYEAAGLGASGPSELAMVAGRSPTQSDGEDDVREFVAEMRVMETLRHRNIVAVVGVVTVSMPVMVLTEWMARGRLSSVVATEALSPVQQLAMAQDVASGMEYLAHRRAFSLALWLWLCLSGWLGGWSRVAQ